MFGAVAVIAAALAEKSFCVCRVDGEAQKFMLQQKHQGCSICLSPCRQQ